jgi:hypothetical protein
VVYTTVHKELRIPKWVLGSISDKEGYIRDLCKLKLEVFPISWECREDVDGPMATITVYRWVGIKSLGSTD